MDKKKIGESIVESILAEYKLSNEFTEDCVHYVYKKIFDEYNSAIANVGFDYWDQKIGTDEFMAKMEVLRNELQAMRGVFEKVFKYSPEYECAGNGFDILKKPTV